MLSSPRVASLWQDLQGLQEITPDANLRGSKDSALPWSILARVIGILLPDGVIEDHSLNISSATSHNSDRATA